MPIVLVGYCGSSSRRSGSCISLDHAELGAQSAVFGKRDAEPAGGSASASVNVCASASASANVFASVNVFANASAFSNVWANVYANVFANV
jgi:hypothetical protein